MEPRELEEVGRVTEVVFAGGVAELVGDSHPAKDLQARGMRGLDDDRQGIVTGQEAPDGFPVGQGPLFDL